MYVWEKRASHQSLSEEMSLPTGAATVTRKILLSPKKAIVTASLNGVLTDPAKFNVPVTPQELAQAAKEAQEEGASVVHVHFRDQRPGKGHLPTWDPSVATDIGNAIREKCPGLLLNFTTGTFGTEQGVFSGGSLGPTKGPLACLDAGKPE
jgi:3-keto-5-aminohexanoate cleavage enzyme